MPSVAELRSRLAKAQTKVSTARLSKSQCIDILLKVCQRRNITLIPTLNGDELLTSKQLETDVVNAIASRGGRVTLAELAASLGVQRNYVDSVVEKILSDHPGTYINLQDILITTEYTDKLMIIANSRLQECGLLNVCEFASEFELPFDMIKMLVSKAKVIEGKLNGNVLESRGYEACKERCVVAALAATTVPTATVHIATLLKLDVNLVNTIISRFVKAGNVDGTLKGGVYTPKTFTEYRNASLTTFYNANGYIERHKIADLVRSNKDDVSKVFPDAMLLETVALNTKAIEPVSVLVKEAIASASWSNVAIVLPAALSAADISQLITFVKGAAKNGYIVEGLYVTNAFEETFLKHVVNILKERCGPQQLLAAIDADGDTMYNHISRIMGDEVESTFAEVWSMASRELYERVHTAAVAMVRKVCAVQRPSHTKGAIDVADSTEKLKVFHMKIAHTLKAVEKICNGVVDDSHLIMKTMLKELLPADCHLLLHVYAVKNRVEIPGDGCDVSASNRNAIIDAIKDDEVKADFKAYVEALKQKDASKCIEASKALRSAMYISCNVKSEKKAFIKAQTTHYKQQLAALSSADALKVIYCTLNIALLKNGHYVFLVDKEWCLSGCMDSLEELVNDVELMGCVRKALQDQGTAMPLQN
ncbi:hypothetical protein X943_002940 [Babesia divergens]|uniref:E3 UFM1-protein ligase 1-like N-terminal domain-containing protein n=1 Tax=Babesia divergens TaxID=32595 RepID=A0AAD9G7J2_BABDI|nr:hypothetical protein X943_002940 [Babesia divergens]